MYPAPSPPKPPLTSPPLHHPVAPLLPHYLTEEITIEASTEYSLCSELDGEPASARDYVVLLYALLRSAARTGWNYENPVNDLFKRTHSLLSLPQSLLQHSITISMGYFVTQELLVVVAAHVYFPCQ